MVQRFERAAAVLVQHDHLAVNERVRRQFVAGSGDLWKAQISINAALFSASSDVVGWLRCS
jgi:hypothetical protein